MDVGDAFNVSRKPHRLIKNRSLWSLAHEPVRHQLSVLRNRPGSTDRHPSVNHSARFNRETYGNTDNCEVSVSPGKLLEGTPGYGCALRKSNLGQDLGRSDVRSHVEGREIPHSDLSAT
jgi:hypothetical protein